MIATGMNDGSGTVHVYDALTLVSKFNFTLSKPVYALKFNTLSNMLAVGGQQNNVMMCNLITGGTTTWSSGQG